jgi:hypothetical protein
VVRERSWWQSRSRRPTRPTVGGADAEGGIGDWYLSNGVVQAVIDEAGVAPDLVGIVPPGQEPPIQSEINPTGGTVIDLGRAGADGDELPQLFSVGGLATDKFFLYQTVSAPSPGVIRATGKLGLPPLSVPPNLCVDAVTEYAVAGSDPFLTMTTTVTNGCAGTHPELGSFLDAVIWTQRGIIPFSAGAGAAGGRGFDHPVLDFANALAAVETPAFVGAPGMLRAEDGVMDPVTGTVSNGLAYGLLPVRVELDAHGPGGAAPVVTPLNTLFGVSSTLVTAMGVLPLGAVPPQRGDHLRAAGLRGRAAPTCGRSATPSSRAGGPYGVRHRDAGRQRRRRRHDGRRSQHRRHAGRLVCGQRDRPVPDHRRLRCPGPVPRSDPDVRLRARRGRHPGAHRFVRRVRGRGRAARTLRAARLGGGT